MSAAQRRKGAEAEREVVRILRAHGWTAAKRTSDGTTQVGRGDVAGGPAGCVIEIKRREVLAVPSALRQVQLDAGPGLLPILVHRPSHLGWMATVYLDELLALLRLREDTGCLANVDRQEVARAAE